jgi:hypothetical protein
MAKKTLSFYERQLERKKKIQTFPTGRRWQTSHLVSIPSTFYARNLQLNQNKHCMQGIFRHNFTILQV